MQVPHSRRALALATTVGAVAAVTGAALVAAPAAGAAPGGTVTITSTLPRWLPKAHKVEVTAKAVANQTVRVYLAPHGGLAALRSEVAALSTPGSAQYRHWLTTAQYDARYAPTAAAADAVSAYLEREGLAVTGVEAHRRYVTASGTPATLGKAFGTTLATYTHDGQTVTANATSVVLPAAVGAQVLTVTGLDTTVSTKTHDSVTPAATPPAGFVNGRPCAINYGTPLATYKADYSTPLPKFKGQTLPYAPCGYTGPQYRSSYEGDLAAGTPKTGIGGKGATVAITDAYAWQYLRQDASRYATTNGDGAYKTGQLTEVPSPTGYNSQAACDPSGWSGEEILDVEAVHAMAPDANIRYYASANCNDDGFLDTLARVVDDNKAQLVTNSWGDTEANTSSASIAAYEQIFLQGATQGVTFFFSSGDNGDEQQNSDVKQTDYPTSDPYVVSAGGTSTGIAHGSIVTQTGWGTHTYSLSANGKSWVDGGFLYGAGGGNSSLFNKPGYQTKRVPSSNGSGRAVPDIAMNADPNTGMLVGQTQKFTDGVRYGEYRIGGTSLASPMLAGFMALGVQSTGAGLGWVNPTLYSTKRGDITDVLPVSGGVVRVNNNNGENPTNGVSYFVRTFDQDSSLATATGWDPVTGLGVPNPGLITSLKPPA